MDNLRHIVATLSYRGAKAVRNAPKGFEAFRASETTRTPGQILAHVGDLLDWCLTLARDGKHVWHDSAPLPWEREVERFHTGLASLDDFLASGRPLRAPAERLFQGPLADALAHVGQICLLRRMAGSPVRGENYFKADIATGQTGPDQPPAVYEFE
jgi:hypothetical protein